MERYRIYSDCALYYVTFSVVDWLTVFPSSAAFHIVTDRFNHCHNMKTPPINGNVIMTTDRS